MPTKRPLTNAEIDSAILAIMAALYPQGEAGWNDWSRYAANGEWF